MIISSVNGETRNPQARLTNFNQLFEIWISRISDAVHGVFVLLPVFGDLCFLQIEIFHNVSYGRISKEAFLILVNLWLLTIESSYLICTIMLDHN